MPYGKDSAVLIGLRAYMKHKGLHVMKRFSFSADLPQPGHILRASQKRKNLKQSLSQDRPN